jgi:hypothetical protein
VRAVRWNPESLIARDDGLSLAVEGMVRVAGLGERVRIDVERSESRRILGRSTGAVAAKARFREGCIKTVEAGIWPLPQKGRVMAEIHRRLDRVPDSEGTPGIWRERLVSIYDFAGAWALAARLIQAGLSVSVIEGEPLRMPGVSSGDGADVEIVIPADPAPAA